MKTDLKYIYAGPSWADSSFPIDRIICTNLGKEWGIDGIKVAKMNNTVLDQIEKIKIVFNDLDIPDLPIIWVYNEPLADMEKILNIDWDTFVRQKDWRDLQKECNRYCLEQINNLGVPVLLIGGHCDIRDCKHENITVAHPSWQKWLAEASGMIVNQGVIEVTPSDGGSYQLSHCWGGELPHRYLHQYKYVRPDPDLLNSIWDMYFFWEELERRNWFFEVHPNYRGNVEFAKFLKPLVDKFLKENSNG